MFSLKVAISFVFVFALIFGLLMTAKWITATTGYSIWEGKKTRVAHCLQDKAVLYVSDNCEECEKQINLFKTDKRFLKTVNCDKTSDECTNIPKTFPVWKIGNDFLQGIRTLEELDYQAQC